MTFKVRTYMMFNVKGVHKIQGQEHTGCSGSATFMTFKVKNNMMFKVKDIHDIQGQGHT